MSDEPTVEERAEYLHQNSCECPPVDCSPFKGDECDKANCLRCLTAEIRAAVDAAVKAERERLTPGGDNAVDFYALQEAFKAAKTRDSAKLVQVVCDWLAAAIREVPDADE